MGSRFVVALLYLINQCLAGLVHRKRVQLVRHTDGEREGALT
jgi:hypothetical protein